MNNKLTAKFALLASAFAGGVSCILADLIQKGDASAILLIGNSLGIIGMPSPTLFAIGIILILSASLPLIFEATSKKGAFYAGASVLAIMVTLTPNSPLPPVEREPNSVQVNLSISAQDGGQVRGAIVTVSRSDAGYKAISRSRMSGSHLKFYLDGGKYRITVELPGYKTGFHTFSLIEGSSPQSLSIKLRRSSVPLFIQRVVR